MDKMAFSIPDQLHMSEQNLQLGCVGKKITDGTLILPSAMAWLIATAMATRPFWSEYNILAWEPTT